MPTSPAMAVRVIYATSARLNIPKAAPNFPARADVLVGVL